MKTRIECFSDSGFRTAKIISLLVAECFLYHQPALQEVNFLRLQKKHLAEMQHELAFLTLP